MKAHFFQLTKEQQETFGNGCGIGYRLLKVPDFAFKASCRHHDFNYNRGGTIVDKIKADTDFFIHMLKDSTKYWHYIVSVIYYVGVAYNPISFFAFTYGQYREIDDIILLDKIKKKYSNKM